MRSQPTPIVTADQQREIADRLAGVDGVFVGLDFDGTLAPIADDPDAPTITPACRRALETFVTHPRATVAVISGRELSDLRARIGIDGIVYAGNHGLELYHGGRVLVHPTAAQRKPAVRRALERVSDRLAHVPGWEIEDKGLTATVHVRQTPPRWIDEVRSAVETSVREVGDGLRVTPGKQVFEIRSEIEWDKGAAIERLAKDTPDRWQTVYIGDDTTDEDAFRAISPDGIGVLVGSRDRTDADYRLPTQAAVAPFLDWLADRVLDRRHPTSP